MFFNGENMTKQEIIDFWVKSSDEDFKEVEGMVASKHYSWALFIGHLVIEKLLKAFFVKTNGKDVPIPKFITCLFLQIKLICNLHRSKKISSLFLAHFR